MDIKTFCKRFMFWTAVIVAVVVLICGLIFGKVIEETIFGEIAKWVVMGLFIIGIFEVFAYTLSQFFYHGSKWDPSSGKYNNAKSGLLPVKYLYFPDSIKILDSYAVPRFLFREALEDIKKDLPDHAIWECRTMASLRREWATHNLLHALGIKRERTADVDLNVLQKWYVKLAYDVVGTIALALVK